jgi:hypothetical protein
MAEPPSITDPRAEAAFRAAILSFDSPVDVDPAGARRTVARRRVATGVTMGVLAVALVVATLYGLPRSWSQDARVVSPSVRDAEGAPAGWRTEYYRNITFQVPSSWTYAEEPNFCAGHRKMSEYPQDYVQLGRHSVQTLEMCTRDKRMLLFQHVAVVPTRGATRDSVHYAQGSWTLTRTVGEADVKVVAYTRRQADQIMASVKTRSDAPRGFCRAHSPIESATGARPAHRFDVRTIVSVTSITLCQYDLDGNGSPASTGLTAKTVLRGAQADDLLTQMKAARPVRPTSCRFSPVFALGMEIRLSTAAGDHDMTIQAGSCEDSMASVGGFDDGTTIRTISVAGCRALLIAPISLTGGSGDVGRNCIR